MAYTPAMPRRAHQNDALAAARKKPTNPTPYDVFAYLMEMGTGKTKVCIDEFGEMEEAKDVSDMLVFAPAGCYANWSDDRSADDPSEFLKHMSPELFKRTAIGRWTSGGGVGVKRRLEHMLAHTGPRALVVNIEAMSTVEKARKLVADFIKSSKRGVYCTVDESTTIKNHKAKRTRHLIKLGESTAVRRIMTGLVTPNSPLDLFAQFEFLDWRILGFNSYRAFMHRYAITRTLDIPGRRFKPEVVVAFKNVEELSQLILPYSYRVLKEDCLDLPPKIYMPVREVELTDVQRRMYDELVEFATAKFEDEVHVAATMVLTQRIRLDQLVCGFIMSEEGELHEVPERRTAELMDVLEDYQGKAIIWTSHDYCIRKISDMLRKAYGPDSVAQFWGGNRSTRSQDEARFKSDPKCRFMVATPSAGGRGNTWVGAGLTIYYNNSDNLEHRMQSEDRNHRDGLMGPQGAGSVTVVDLCASGTIDYKKIKALRGKMDIASMIQQEGYREWII